MKKNPASQSGLFNLRVLLATALCALGAFLAILSFAAKPPGGISVAANRVLGFSKAFTFEQRLADQRAIEEVRWRHREWPANNAAPKPSLSQVFPETLLRDKVLDGLRMSNALESIWHDKITAERLQAEINRMVRSTRQPEVLNELFEALENDPHRIAESLARPLLASRLLRNAYTNSHAERGAPVEVANALASGQPFEFWWRAMSETMPTQVEQPAFGYSLPATAQSSCVDDSWQPTPGVEERSGHTAVWTGSEMLIWGGFQNKIPDTSNAGNRYDPATDTWTSISLIGAPEARGSHTAIWTGTHMIVWGGEDYATSTFLNTGGRYDPATDSWTPSNTANAPFARINHTAVWTGNEMIVWGGQSAGCIADPTHCIDFQLNRGGRYNPSTDQWTLMGTDINAPTARSNHTAVWTGNVMVVWGGSGFFPDNFYKNDGGRYDPSTDTWQTVSTTNAPDPRDSHKAVWTGNEMFVWGGYANAYLGTGGRYNPITDAWVGTTLIGAPEPRTDHTVVWTGSQMIVWGGIGDFVYNNGAGYFPNTDSWQPISDTAAPSPRDTHTAVWTGNEMIVWGGELIGSYLNTGGRYKLATNTWVPTSTEGAPDGRMEHTAVWTGAEMIVWGGCGANACGISFPNPSGPPAGSGGRYDPATDTWTPTSLINGPDGRKEHSAVWTGQEMIVWGGENADGRVNTGGRYNPASDTWMAASTIGAPDARGLFTAVWSGSEMIVWGGHICANPPTCDEPFYINTGGRYNPSTDTWLPTELAGAPSGRTIHVAVWAGNEMIVWGGFGCDTAGTCAPQNATQLNTGGRYRPASGTWVATPTTGAPAARDFFSGVWTGKEMIVWGGGNEAPPYFNTGGRYNPATDTWAPTTTSGAPVGRNVPTTVWTGQEMIVWGGYDDSLNGINTGGRYNPATDAWRAMTTVGAPTGRDSHTAVWSGSEMIVWGGRALSPLSSGGRYCASVSVPPVQVASVVSRKTHGSAGTFDVDLPLSGNPGIECRSGGANGNYTIVFSFVNTIGNVSSAGVTTGTGSVVSGAIGADLHQYIVNLKGVANAQVVTVTLTNVNDSAGNYSPAVAGQMGVLIGDVNANRLVNSTDTSLVQAQSGKPVTLSNYRMDVNANGLINSTDTSTVQSKSGTGF